MRDDRSTQSKPVPKRLLRMMLGQPFWIERFRGSEYDDWAKPERLDKPLRF